MNDDIEKVQPFDSFSAVYRVLGLVGYIRPLNKPSSKYKRIFHEIYSLFAFLIGVIYNVQHLIFTAQNHHNVNKLVDCLMIEIPQMNLLTKLATVYLQKPRIHKLNRFLKDDPIFHATDEASQSILQKNKKEMHRLCRLLLINVSIVFISWIISFFIKRYNDPEEVIPSYVPFATDTWLKFSFSVLIECGPILWTGYGHLALDTLVLTFYAHAQAQLKIIKQHLENFAGKKENGYYLNNCFQYRDLDDENIRKRFIQLVKRYEKLIWYKNEIDDIFNFSISFQFFSYSSAVTFIVYRMTIVHVISITFLFLLILFCTLLIQVFLYCYYGNLVEFESRSVNTSLYNSDWLALSPRFRRLMLIAMIRWSQPIQPCVCSIIPLCLNTFVTIVKCSYTLYTVLVTAEFNNN